MKHTEGFLKGVRESNIYYQSWHPKKEAKAVLLIVPGMAEHSGRYMNLVNYFVPEGFALYGLDHIGHGKSDGTRILIDRFSDYTKTLKAFVNLVAEKETGKPIFIVGHSMGGLIAPIYLIDHQTDFKGAVISAPSVKIAEDTSPVAVVLSKILSKLAPKAGLLPLDSTYVSSDPAVVESYVNDPLVYKGKMTARLASEILSSMQRVTDEAHKINLPTIIVQGSEDKLVNPAGAKHLYDLISSEDKTLKIYDGFYHEVFNEPEHEVVMDDIHDWLKKRI